MTPAISSQSQGPVAENIFVIQDSKEFGTRIAQRVRDMTMTNQGTAFALHYTNVSTAYTHLYGLDIEGVGANAAVVTRSGDQGSIAELRIPAAAGQLTKVWNLVVGPELAWTAVATTTDVASDEQAITTKNALQYYWVDKGVATKAKSVAFEALGFAEGVLHIPWNESLGEDAGVDESDPENPTIVKTGDIDYRPVSTWDLIRDPTLKSYEGLPYIIVREWQNRFDVAAMSKDPETKEAALTSAAQQVTTMWRPFNQNSSMQTEQIPVYYCYHKRTGAVPMGRQTVFLETGDVVSDSPLDKAYWKHLPVVRMAAGEYSGTPFPYSKFFATLGAAQAADSLYRDLLTNATATSGGLVWTEDDNETSPIQLGGGPKIIVGAKGSKPPEALQLQQSHPEHFNLIGKLRNETQQILGLDNLTAGQEIGANLSGAAMALLTSTSVQNNSQLQAAWAKFVQDIGNVTLAHIQHHMKEPRKIALAGNARADMVTTTELSGNAVDGVDRVQCQLGPALQQTDAGRYELMQTMLKQPGWVETPQQAQTVMDTGRFDALTEDRSNELILIKLENKAISEGQTVPAMLGDDHILHLKGHRSITASVTARQNKAVVDAAQAHEAEHLKILKDTDPGVLKVFGQPSIAAPPAPGISDSTKLGAANLAVKSGWAPSPQQAQAVFESGKLDAGNPQPGVGAPSPQAAAQQAGPSMPTNPVTGQKAGPVAGTPSPQLAVRPS